MSGSCDNGFIFIGRDARWSDFAPRAWFNFSDVSNIDQRRDREGFMLALSPHRLRLRRGRSPCCKSGARAYHSEFMGSRPRCPLSKQEPALQLRPDYRDFALILHSQRNLYTSCGDYAQRENPSSYPSRSTRYTTLVSLDGSIDCVARR